MSLRATRVRGHLTPAVRRRVRIGAAALGFLLLALWIGGGILVHQGVGCTACHSMRPYSEALTLGGHSDQGCADCHVESSLLAIPADGLRMMGWIGGTMLGRDPGPTHDDDGACRECHAAELDGVVASRGVSVRHSDFIAQPCDTCHAGTGHRVEYRYYRLLEMDDCLVCHKAAATDTDSCGLCHTGDAERVAGDTSWRSTHGEGWESTHGMGEISTCISCHVPAYCVQCHGTRIPHPTDWPASHGASAIAAAGSGCATCHDPAWCADCHGLEMPHAATFLPVHGLEARELGDAACNRCHPAVTCDVCHYASSHPDVPGVTTGHGW